MSTTLLSNIRSSLGRLRGVLLLTALLSGTVGAVDAAAPAVGTTIENTATATFTLPGPDAVSQTVTSNKVVAVITNQVESISLTPDRQVESSAGGIVSFVHTLENTGSVDTNVRLQYTQLTTDNFDLGGLQLIEDTNNNGVADPGERVLGPTDEVALKVGEKVQLILTGTVPGTVNDADLSKLQMFGTTTGGSTSQTVNDTVTIKAFIAPTLSKSASVANSTAGGLISYTLNLMTGSSLTTRAVTVDGITRQLIVVRDAIPADTNFVSVQQNAGSLVLYQVYGGGIDQYQTAAPSDLSSVSTIAFGFSTLDPNKSVIMQFQVQVAQDPHGNISNTGVIDATINGKPGTVPSNPVVVTVPPKSAVLQYRDPTFSTVVPTAYADPSDNSKSDKLNLYATASACNLDPSKPDMPFVTLMAARSNDLENGPATQNVVLQMVETGANTGIFKLANVPTKLVDGSGINNNGVVEVQFNDTVTATLSCGTVSSKTTIDMNPAAVVFNSKTNEVVPHVGVLLIKDPGSTNAKAGDLTFATYTTNDKGQFGFPKGDPGSYAIRVLKSDLDPLKLVFPSSPDVAKQNGRRYDSSVSFNKPFQSDGSVSSFTKYDIPVDPMSNGLVLDKLVQNAKTAAAEIGETVTYTLTLTNNTGKQLTSVKIDDMMPVGFSLVSGSVRDKNRARVPNPEGAPGRHLTFDVGTMDVNSTAVFTYVVVLGTGAGAGNGINTATGSGTDVTLPVDQQKVSSTPAIATVTVSKGVFSDQAVVFGKIFVDCNRDDLQGHEELGIPGVRLYMDDGTYVISDEEGKYSLYGITPRTHVLKIDRTTLPAGSEMATLSNRNAGDPQSLFLDVKNGEMHRADFAEGSCTPEIIKEVKARRKAGEVLAAKVDTIDAQNDPLLQPLRTTAQSTVDTRSLPSSGVIGSDGKIVADAPYSLIGPTSERSIGSPLGAAPLAVVPSVNLEALLPKMKDNKFGFLDLQDGDTLPGTDLSIRIGGRDGSNFRLFVNDEEISSKRIGQRANMPSRDLQVWEYIGIKLMPGVNKLRAENLDTFGNLHETSSIMLKAPGKPGKLVILLPPDGAVADGQTPAHILVRLLDADDVPVTARTLVTLESTAGRWNVEDLDAKEPGVQTFIQGGEAVFDLIPPSNPGNADLRVSSGVLEDSARLPLDAHLRPLIASGLIEGAIGLNKLSNKSVQAATPADGFEQDIKSLTADGSSTQAGIRGSMFLKGKVKGNYLLTLAYDSDKDTQERLFRDIDPENYYPIYGDSSIKGFDAQSTSALYVRIDKGRSYLLYGDFNTNEQTSASQARQLSNYSRSLTGVREHYENDKVTVNLFASHQTSQQRTTEFRGQGISGPYQLPGGHFLVNSEKIEVIVRDRNQPGVVISTTEMNRFVDYTIDELKGSIIFTSPVAGVDGPNNNPVFIRVTWEVESGGDAYWVYGADGTYHLTKFLDVGASVVRDNTPAATSTIYGVNSTLALSKDTKATIEYAHSQGDAVLSGTSTPDVTLDSSGNAWRAELTRSGAGIQGRVYASRSDASFYNPNGGLTSGTTEAGVKGGWQLNESLRLAAEGLYTKSDVLSTGTGTGAREGIFTSIEYALTQNIKTSLGVRFTRQEETNAGADYTNISSVPAPIPQSGYNALEASNTTSINGKVSWIPQFLPKSSLFTEYEQSVSDAAAKALGIGGTYQIGDRSRFYASHQLIKSTTGPFGLSELSQNQNTTAVGVDYDYMKNGNVFSEYRIRDSLDGESGGASAAVGLRNSWNWAAFKVSTQFEREQALDSSVDAQGNTALSVGIQYIADPLLKAGTRFEWRQGAGQKSFLDTIAMARKLSLDWSILAKNTLSWTSTGTESSIVPTEGLVAMGGATIRDRFRVGAAWRQTDSNEWAWLGLYETRYDRDPSIDNRRIAHILSSNVNYQPNRQWVLNGRYAMKFVDETSSGVRNHFIGNLVSGRAMFDISEKWDAGVVTSVVFDQHTIQYGVGAEVGYLITSNLWLSGGYNFTGYEDKDYDASNSTRQGPYMRLRFKFDEEMFRWLE